MWWDERPLAESHTHQTAVSACRRDNIKPLKVYIDLDCPYVR